MSLWSFAHPQKSLLRVVTGADETSAVEQAALRFDRLVSIAEVAKATAAELPPPDGYNWFQPGEIPDRGTHRNATHNLRPPFERAESQVSHTAEDQITQASARLDKWLDDGRKTLIGPHPDKTAASTETTTSPTSHELASPAANEWTYYVAEGGNDRLPLRFRSLEPTPTQNRLIGLLVIACSLIAAISLMRRPPPPIFSTAGHTRAEFCWASRLGLVVAELARHRDCRSKSLA